MTLEEIIRMAREADIYADKQTVDQYDRRQIRDERFANLVAAAEREACAKVCDERKITTPEWQLDQHYNQACGHCAAAIRARGNT